MRHLYNILAATATAAATQPCFLSRPGPAAAVGIGQIAMFQNIKVLGYSLPDLPLVGPTEPIKLADNDDDDDCDYCDNDAR